jgi:hypothetical protein
MTTTKKTCFKCKSTLPLDSFYKHAQMGDGMLNKCIECAKKDVIENRLNNIEHYRAFDKARASKPSRVLARKLYRQTDAGKAAVARAHKKWEAEHPERRKAIVALGNAVRDKKLERQPCFVCGKEKVEAHHPIYSMPLDVVWLCNHHHRLTHAQAMEYAEAA